MTILKDNSEKANLICPKKHLQIQQIDSLYFWLNPKEPHFWEVIFWGEMKLALSFCYDFHSRTLWHTTLHTWSTFLIVKKPDDITVLKEEKILCIVFFMTFLKYSFPGPLIRATQNFHGVLDFFLLF